MAKTIDHEAEVKSWGFSKVITWTDEPNTHYPPHSHRGLTTLLILKGQLSMAFPKEENVVRTTYVPGDRIDVDAERVHEVWIGAEGCTSVIGE